MMKAPERLSTARLVLRRPTLSDADEIFKRYAGDTEVTRYVGWPRHRTVDDSRAFIEFSNSAWSNCAGGPYLIVANDTNAVLGSTGFVFEEPHRAQTGFVLARDAWGKGIAVEAMLAMVALSPALGIRRLFGLCHVEHRRSARALEKSGFDREGVLKRFLVFPNLADAEPADVFCYARVF